MKKIKTVKSVAAIIAVGVLLSGASFGEREDRKVPDLELKLVYIEPGTFEMGSRLSPDEVEEKYGGYSSWYEDEHTN